MAKFFVKPFAVDGNKQTIPDGAQPSGSVSYEEGFGLDYQLDFPTDPDALPIPRQETNQLFYDITDAIRQYQTHGIPDFITAVENGGSAFSYDKGALVLYDDGTNGIRIFQSKVDANTSLPTDVTKWRWIDNSAGAIIFDNATFEGTVADGDAVYWDEDNSWFAQALANGDSPQNVIGIADVTFSRVYQFGLTPILTGLTPGAVYFLSDSAPGAITTTPPQSYIIQVGIAQNATTLLLSPRSVVPKTNIIKFTASGTYTPSKNLVYAIVEVQAPGGGGGGAAGGASTSAAASGAGAGAYAKSLLLPSDIGASQAVTIGNPGTGGAAGNNNGTAGGNATFGSLITCTGGQQGLGGLANASAAGTQPGQGGIATGGNLLNINGSSGLPGFKIDSGNVFGGAGGPAQFGNLLYSLPNATAPNATGYGSGGPGAFRNFSNSSALAGGNGAPGIVIITEYLAY